MPTVSRSVNNFSIYLSATSIAIANKPAGRNGNAKDKIFFHFTIDKVENSYEYVIYMETIADYLQENYGKE